MNTECYDSVATAKFVRKDLKLYFPGIKFSVKSSHHTISISWINGPTQKEVEAITDKYGGMTFDGMDDGTKYSKSIVAGQFVQCYCYRPSAKRHLTSAFAHKLLVRVKEMYLTMPCLDIKISDFSGHAYFDRYSTDLTFDQECDFLAAINSLSESDLNKPYEGDIWQIDLERLLRDRLYLENNHISPHNPLNFYSPFQTRSNDNYK